MLEKSAISNPAGYALLSYRVITTGMKRMAAKDTTKGEKPPPGQPIGIERLKGVLRARGGETAAWWGYGRKDYLVTSNTENNTSEQKIFLPRRKGRFLFHFHDENAEWMFLYGIAKQEKNYDPIRPR